MEGNANWTLSGYLLYIPQSLTMFPRGGPTLGALLGPGSYSKVATLEEVASH